VSDQWLPASPVTGHLDAFQWRVPLTGIVSAAAVIEPEPPPAALPAAPPAPEPPEAEDRHEPEAAPPAPADDAAAAPPPSAVTAQPLPPKPDPVIPLVHAPDDPGPEVVVDEETETAEEPKPRGWRKLFG